MKTDKTKRASTSGSKALVRQTVRKLLARSPAFSELSARVRGQITRDTTSVAAYLTDIREGTEATTKLIEEVGFPAFVSGLINGVFQAIVTMSIDQMKAYAELVATVAKSLDRFRDKNVSGKQARDFLARQSPKFLTPHGRRPQLVLPAKRRLATQRQQLLATMLLMGINRIVVTNSKKPARRKRATS